MSLFFKHDFNKIKFYVKLDILKIEVYIYFEVEFDISNVKFYLNFQKKKKIKWQNMHKTRHF